MKRDQFKLGGNPLRQKAINLFYLIFLILLFTYIPADFVDSAYHSNQSLDLLSNDINQLNKDHVVYFLHLLKAEPELFEDSKRKFIEIENLAQITTSYIDSLKIELINVDKMNEFGYFKNGRKEITSNAIMIHQEKAQKLFNKLQAFKTTLSEYVSSSSSYKLKEILPLTKYERTSDGKYKTANNYYFDKTPLNVSVLNLSHFKSRVERAKVFAHKTLIEEITFENAKLIPFDAFKINETEQLEDVYAVSTIQEFFNRINPNNNLVQQKSEIEKQLEEALEWIEQNKKKVDRNYYIETLTDSIHPAGKAIRYKADFEKGSTKLEIQVKTDKGTEYFKLNTPGSFYYFPKSKGRYSFIFNNGKKRIVKDVTVIDTDPIIQNTKLSTLYIGIDNPLNIKTSEFDEDDNLLAEITDGQIIKKGNIFYARVYKKGITQVRIYAQMPYGKVKLAEKSFIIRELQAPTPSLNGVFSGGTVSVNNLGQLETLSLKTDEYLVDEDVYIAECEFMMIYDGYNRVTKPIINKGSSLNQGILNAIRNAESGDILIFSNIKTLSSRGTQKVIPTLTIKVI